jgi:dephospho-CoA kinase
MPTIGLTGNFGMGKTTVLRLFHKSGAFTYDVDEFVHNILKKPAIMKKAASILGEDVLTKKQANISIDKKRTADIIFHMPEKRKAIEKIIHPEVMKAVKLAESEILEREPSAIIIFEVPLLFEAGYESNFDRIVVVYCRRNTALTRLFKKGVSKDAALRRIRTQMPITAKKKMADFVIDNNEDMKKTELQVKRIFEKIRGKA